MPHHTLSRRQFVSVAGATLAGMGVAAAAPPRGGLPRVTQPRATSGDKAFEPKWDEKLTIGQGAAGGR